MSKRRRKAETKSDMCATLILQHCKTADGKPIMTRREAREQKLTAEQIIRAWRKTVIRQHGAAHATDGSCEPYNIWYLPRELDALETPKDISRIAKGKRLAKQQAKFRAKLLSKTGQAAAPSPKAKRKHRWPSRPFPKRQRVELRT